MAGIIQNNIPPSLPIFIGREKEINKIENALTSKDINAIIIYGIGGVGKTTLAQFVARRQKEKNRFPGGIVWVDCTLYGSLSQILVTIAHTLGVEPASPTAAALRDAVVSRLQSNSTLLIFDNYEEVAQNDEVLSFIGRLPKRTKALIVSRLHAHIPGRAIQIPLEGFTQIETLTYLQRQQYLSSKQEIRIDNDALKTLYEKTGGLPLAVALATNLLKQGLPLAQIEESSDRIADFLLKSVVRNIPEDQRRFLDALSLFAHSAEGEAIALVAEVKNWHEVGQALELISLIDVVDGRYALHPLVRTYIRSQLPPERLSSLQQRMVQYFLDYVKGSLSNFDQLDREWPNIEYAIEIASYSNGLGQEFLDFVLILGQFLNARGYENEYQRWLNIAIEASNKLNDRRLTAALLHNLGVQYQRQGKLSNALESYLQSLQQERELGDRLGEANTLAQLGTIYFQLRDLVRAREIYQKALHISRTLGDIRSESSLLGNLGLISRETRNYKEAESLLRQALAITHGLGDRQAEANLLTNLGTIATDLARYREAESLLRQALAITRELGDRRAEANLLTNLGLIYTHMKWYDRAEEYFQEALAICSELGDRQAEANLLTNLGTIATDMGRYQEAETLFQEALTINHQIGDPQVEATLYTNLGTLYMNRLMGNHEENLGHAIDFYNQALQIVTEKTNPFRYATLQHNLANAYANLPTGNRSNDLEQALAHYQEALHIFTPQAFPLQWAATQNNLASVYSHRLVGDHLENLRQAIATYTQALQVYTRESFPVDWLRVITSLSMAHAEIGNWPEAKQLATNVLQAFHGTKTDPVSFEAITLWYQGIGELAIQNQDVEFATRVFAEAAYIFELQGEKVPNSIQSKLVELSKKLGEDRFVITWAEVQGLLTPILAQILQNARQLMSKEQYQEAEDKLSKALEELSKAENTKEQWRQQGTILFMRGFCLRKQERWSEALEDQVEAFKLFEKLRDYEGTARTLLEIGHLLEVMNNYEDARLYYMDAYSLYRRTENKHGLALASENLGRLEYRVRMFPQAVQDLEEARILYISLGEQIKATSIESDLEDAKASLAYQIAKKKKRSENE